MGTWTHNLSPFRTDVALTVLAALGDEPYKQGERKRSSHRDRWDLGSEGVWSLTSQH